MFFGKIKEFWSNLNDCTDSKFENDFRASLIEIESSPPSKSGRYIVFAILAILLIAIVWSIFGRIDIVANAQGKVIPVGKIKTVQSFDQGSVKEIHVVEGQYVRKGNKLVTLDTTKYDADIRRLRNDILVSNLLVLRNQSMLDAISGEEFSYPDYEAAGIIDEAFILKSNIQLDEQYGDFLSKKDLIDSEIVQEKANLRRSTASIEMLREKLKLSTKRRESVSRLWDKKMISEHDFMKTEDEYLDLSYSLKMEIANNEEIQAKIESSLIKLRGLNVESRNGLMSMNEEYKQRVYQFEQELIKAEMGKRFSEIKSPSDGYVVNVKRTTVGAVLTAAEELMQIVPDKDGVEVEAFVLNKDIGFVDVGMDVAVKIDSFNFTKYGVVDGKLAYVSDDAINDENLGLVYKSRIKLNKSHMLVENKRVNLGVGMSVNAEIKTGNRRIVEFFLSPILKRVDQSVKVR